MEELQLITLRIQLAKFLLDYHKADQVRKKIMTANPMQEAPDAISPRAVPEPCGMNYQVL